MSDDPEVAPPQTAEWAVFPTNRLTSWELNVKDKPDPRTGPQAQDPGSYVPAREITPFGQFQLSSSRLLTGRPGAAKFGGSYPHQDFPQAPLLPKTDEERDRNAGITIVEMHGWPDDSEGKAEVKDTLQALGLMDP